MRPNATSYEGEHGPRNWARDIIVTGISEDWATLWGTLDGPVGAKIGGSVRYATVNRCRTT